MFYIQFPGRNLFLNRRTPGYGSLKRAGSLPTRSAV